VHIARAEHTIRDHEGRKNLLDTRRPARVHVHVPQPGNEVLAAPVDDGRAPRDSDARTRAYGRDGSSTDFHGHVGLQASGDHVDQGHMRNEE